MTLKPKPIEDAAAIAWIDGVEGVRHIDKLIDSLEEEYGETDDEPVAVTILQFALHDAFRAGFAAGRSTIQENGGTVLRDT